MLPARIQAWKAFGGRSWLYGPDSLAHLTTIMEESSGVTLPDVTISDAVGDTFREKIWCKLEDPAHVYLSEAHTYVVKVFSALIDAEFGDYPRLAGVFKAQWLTKEKIYKSQFQLGAYTQIAMQLLWDEFPKMVRVHMVEEMGPAIMSKLSLFKDREADLLGLMTNPQKAAQLQRDRAQVQDYNKALKDLSSIWDALSFSGLRQS
ncbi:hypothetical protein WJX73_008352 [Symbiochloris irregularis]|uniref:GED domain-containing protein n=1 Tax=Symbiochloris irregularis TaxID=706552 RepID=A0AAW1NTP9_9CHLO